MKNGNILAFDIGLKRTGVALGQWALQSSRPLTTLHILPSNWATLDKIIDIWQPVECVLGQPHTQDTKLSKHIRRIKHHLQAQHKILVTEIDETLTTFCAQDDLSTLDISLKKKHQLKDQIAACYILSAYFQQQPC